MGRIGPDSVGKVEARHLIRGIKANLGRRRERVEAFTANEIKVADTGLAHLIPPKLRRSRR